MNDNKNDKAHSHLSIARWIVLIVIIVFSLPAISQDQNPVNNKGKIKQTRAKSVKKKEKASTKDIAGKRLRTKNANSVAGRAVYSNPSPYANERRGKDRVAKPIGGQPTRIRSRSGESARNNVYPQRGPFVNHRSKSTSTKSNRFTRSRPRSKSTSGESSRSNVYPQKGPFVNRSSKQPGRTVAQNKTRTGRLSTNSRITKTYSRTPRSASQSAETTKGKRFGQGGAFVNQSSRSTENVASGGNRYGRKTKLSAGPRPPGKKRTVIPRSASQQFVTKGRKDVYWGKFSKGERAITTDISGNPLRRKNYRTPPNEIIKPKDPYATRKKSKGDRAYSGTFISGHVSTARRTENPWKGDLSGQAVRKRSDRQNQVAGERIGPSRKVGGLSAKIQRTFDTKRGIKPPKGGGGSVTGKYKSNKPLGVKAPGIGAAAIGRNQDRTSGVKPIRGAGGSVTGKYRSNKPLTARAPGIGASAMLKGQSRITGIKPVKGGGGSVTGKYKSNKPLTARAPGIGASAMLKGQNRITGIKPIKGAGGSVTGKYKSNKPLTARAPGIGASAMLKGQNRITGIKPKKGGGRSISGKAWNNNNQPIFTRPPGIGGSAMAKYQSNLNPKKPTKTFDQGGLDYYKGSGAERAKKGKLTATEKTWNNNDRALPAPNYGKKANRIAKFQGNAKVREPEKGGGSVSGKIWNNNGQPIEVRTPTGAQANKVDYAAKVKRPIFKRAYSRNPNAVANAIKQKSPMETVFMTDGLQVSVKAKQTGTKPKAVKGSMPGLAPSKATVKASEYNRSIKMFWNYKHNPSSVDESQKTIAPSKYFVRASSFSGKTRLTKNYRHNPMSHKDALKVIAPGRAYARITDYQGNIKMSKYNDKRFMPDSKFAHNKQNNVKQERTIMTDFKLLWTKIFKKNGTQPNAVKEKSVRPRYDKRERELWPGLYD